MKLSGLITLLTLMLAVSVSAQEPVSRFGKLQIIDSDFTKHQLMFNDQELYDYDGVSIEILKVFNGIDKDFAIIALNSGGISCPMQVVIIELFKSGAHKESKEFGSCSDLIETKFLNGKVIIETPMYVPHPDLLTKTELKRMEKLKEVYTWYQGRLVKAIKPR